MTERIIKIGCGYSENITIFSLRSISLSEENRFTSKFAEIDKSLTEEQQSELEYDILVDAVSSWVSEVSTRSKGDEETLLAPSNDISASQYVRDMFSSKTADKSRVLNTLVLEFRSKLQPKVVFY